MLKGNSVANVLHSRHNSVSQGYSVGQVLFKKKKKQCTWDSEQQDSQLRTCVNFPEIRNKCPYPAPLIPHLEIQRSHFSLVQKRTPKPAVGGGT